MRPSERFEKSITKDNLWLYILWLLSQREMYGYEIRPEIKRQFGFLPGKVTAYIVLNRLLASGYIRTAHTSQAGGPLRKYFAITNKGREELSIATDIYKKRLNFLKRL